MISIYGGKHSNMTVNTRNLGIVSKFKNEKYLPHQQLVAKNNLNIYFEYNGFWTPIWLIVKDL